MPPLPSPRHEAFAQALFIGLGGKTRQERANSTAYLTAYPGSTAPGSAKASAARLLARVNPILERVRELQAEQNARLQPKLDLSRERIGKRLNLASTIAEQERNAQAITAAELGIAKVFGHIDREAPSPQDFATANSMQDMGGKLLQSVGLAQPDDQSIGAAIEANDAFVRRLEEIRDAARATVDA